MSTTSKRITRPSVSTSTSVRCASSSCTPVTTVVTVPPGTGSVGEVPGAGEVHRHAGRLAGGDRLLVAHRPARLDDGPDAGVDEHLGAVGEREERVGRRN